VQRFSKSIVLAALTRAQQLTRGPVKRQATAIGMLLRFLRLSVLAFAVGEGHVQRFVAEVMWTGDEPWLNFRLCR